MVITLAHKITLAGGLQLYHVGLDVPFCYDWICMNPWRELREKRLRMWLFVLHC
jgi:hypothetical protein